ncbi:kinase-like protein [Xylariaceae sp. FL1651]|nr:kinase-like protein [Xylariaceae sp. FL1651]
MPVTSITMNNASLQSTLPTPPPLSSLLYSRFNVSKPCNFITFLGMAQKLQIRFLPNTWQETRPPIGEGATSQIHQSLLDPRTGFAFKRVGDRDKRERPEKDIFQHLINEIVILSQAQIRNHPSILELQGICWDIPDPAESLDSTKDKVWPVLVFEKSRYGDLFSFAHSEDAQELDIHGRLALCGQIGRAVARMHSNRIIHGDLKPQNILIFKDEHDFWLARVADFGFSKWHTSELDPLELPHSWPWYAPEYDEYPSFTPQQAMRMDVFSFGMLSLWLIFNKSLLGFIPLKNKPKESRSSDGNDLLEVLAEWKQRRLLTEFAHRLVMQEADLDAAMQKKLQRLFNGSLVHEPHLRDVNMVHLMDAIDMAE